MAHLTRNIGRSALLAALLMAVLCAELTCAARTDGLAFDEIAYVAAGSKHLFEGDYRVNPEHPPLSKLVAALPLVPLHPAIPALAADDSLWSWSRRFMHEANAADRIVPRARIGNGVLTMALAALVWAWARRTYGAAAGAAALALAVFHPSLLAHGHIAGSDLPAALAMVAASWCLWRWTLAPTPARAIGVGLAAGVALATRLSTLVILPAFALVVLVEVLARRRMPSAVGARPVAVLVASVAVAVPLVIWAAYGFRYAAWPGTTLLSSAPPASAAEALILRAGRMRLLPEAYLEGARRFAEVSRDAPAPYLLGRRVPGGSRAYYVVAFVVKSTPGFLLACAMAVATALAGRRPRDAATEPATIVWHWAIPAAVVFAVASASGVQIGERYVLAAYPFLILLVASAVPRVLALRHGGWLLTGVFLLHAVPSLLQAPRGYLAYFNALAGGTDGGHRVLADSNLDWGQDLPRLAAWMTARSVDRVQLGYFGHDDPARFGIRHKDLPGSHSCASGPPGRPFRGWVAVSPALMTSSPPGGDPYALLAGRGPDARAGVFFIYSFPE